MELNKFILLCLFIIITSFTSPYKHYKGQTQYNYFIVREDCNKKQFSIEISDELNYPLYTCYSQQPYEVDNFVKKCEWKSSWNGKVYNNSYKIWIYDPERNVYKNKLIYRNKIYIFYTKKY